MDNKEKKVEQVAKYHKITDADKQEGIPVYGEKPLGGEEVVRKSAKDIQRELGTLQKMWKSPDYVGDKNDLERQILSREEELRKLTRKLKTSKELAADGSIAWDKGDEGEEILKTSEASESTSVESAVPEKETAEVVGEPEKLKEMAEDLPIIRVVDTFLEYAIFEGASDIHIEPMETEVLVRYRIDGILHDAMTLPSAAAAGIVARIKVLSNLKLDEKRLPQDGRFKMETEADRVSFRVSILPTFFGEKTVMRLLRETGEGFTLEVLGLHGENMERIHKALTQTTGIILISGPTGSGKTTTLYTMLDILNRPDVNISTVEDPIEYQMPRVNQTQVNPQIGFTFANGLRSLVRQDPDIIMVGEIRDGETASLAINAALTGHLVLSTIHTNSAAGAIPRLIDMGVEPFLLVSTIRVIIGQRLVRKLCESKESYPVDAAMRATIASEADFAVAFAALVEEKLVKKGSALDDLPFYRPTPTPECADGYKGRIGIHEVLAVSPAIREIMLRSSTTDAIEAQARKEGMLTMFQDGLYKAARGTTSVEEVLRAITE